MNSFLKIVCLLVFIPNIAVAKTQPSGGEIEMPEGFKGIYLGMSKSEFLKIRPKANVHPMDSGEHDLMDPNIGLSELVESDLTFGLNMLGMYEFREAKLKNLLIIWGGDAEQIREHQVNFISASLKKWGTNYQKRIIKQQPGKEDEYLAPLLLWQKENTIIAVSCFPDYDKKRFKKGAFTMALFSKDDKEFLELLRGEKVSKNVLNELFEKIDVIAMQSGKKPVVTDPSLVPLDLKDKPDFISLKGYERYRYVADFNFDGIMDLALSLPISTFGTGGGWYTLYLGNADGDFIKLDEQVSGGSMSLRMQKAGEGILYVSSHCGGGCASVTEYSVSVSGIKEISSKILHLGDYDDSLQEDNDEFDRIFNDKDVLIRQISKTINSKVIWHNDFPKAIAKNIDDLVIEIVARATANDYELFRNSLDASYKGQEQKLVEMILRSEMENNYKQKLEYISPSRARVNYHYLEKGCHFQIQLEKEKDWEEKSNWWTIRRIWFCR